MIPPIDSDSTVPDDPPTTSSKLLVPDAVNIQPPTPGNVSPIFEMIDAEPQQQPFVLRNITMPKIYGTNNKNSIFSSSLDQTYSDSELRRAEYPPVDVKTSFSDGSLRGKHNNLSCKSMSYCMTIDCCTLDSCSTGGSRKISSGSTFRLFERAPSPQRNFLPGNK